ncbi:MAG: sigma-70 family RNA polymerase sigma factor [Pseudomonadota bacterium]
MQAVSDEQLISWVADGDSSCLGTLFERHHRGIYQFCLQLTRNPALAEDLTQEIFIRVLRKAGSFRGEGCFKAWLYNVARNLTFDELRKNKRRGITVPEPDAENLGHMVDERSAEQSASDKQRLDQLETALARLPEAAREVIWLGRFEFEGYDELAQALGCKPGAARVRMHRAMNQLNDIFKAMEVNPAHV